MLARKRKLQDDEPLVPHGLVSQALDAERSPSEVPTPYDREISPTQSKAEDPDPSLPKPPQPAETARPPKVSSGRLLRWPKMRERLGNGFSTPQFIWRLRDLRKQFSENTAATWGRLNTTGPWSRVRAFGETGISQVRDELRSVREHAVPELQKVRDSVELPAKIARVRQAFSTGRAKASELYRLGRTYSAERLRELIKHSRAAMRVAWTGVMRKVPRNGLKLRANLDRSVSIGAVGKFRLWRTSSAGHVRSLIKHSEPPMPAIRSGLRKKLSGNGLKLRVKLEGIPLKMRIAFARAKLEYQLGREYLSKESRAWTSIALGAMAALLIVGLFSTARHFAQAALPSSRVSANSSPETTSVSAASLAPQAQKKVVAARAVSKQTSTKPEPQPKSKATTAKPKTHRNSDEDYVAKDTYVYYGNRRAR